MNAEVITTHVTDIEEPHCRPLLERVALRNLEEMVVTNQIDSDAIPLLKALTGQDLGPLTNASSVKQWVNRKLVLRVQTEVNTLSLLLVGMASMGQILMMICVSRRLNVLPSCSLVRKVV